MAAPPAGFVHQFVSGLLQSNNPAPRGPPRSNVTPIGSQLPFSLSQKQQQMIRDDIAKVQTPMGENQTLPPPRKNPLPPPPNIFPGQANPVPLEFKGDENPTLSKQADREDLARAEAAKKKPADDPDGFKIVKRNPTPPPKPQVGSLLGTNSLKINHGRWAQLNPGTTSCSNSRVIPTGQAPGGGVTFAERPLDNVLRSLAIDAMTEMNKAPIPASWAERLKPSVMGILVGLGVQNVSEPSQTATPPSGSASAPDNTRAGWQIYLHSSAKGSPKQANLHPELTNRLQKAGLTFHHFSGSRIRQSRPERD